MLVIHKDFGFGTEFVDSVAFREALRAYRSQLSDEEIEEAFIAGRDAERAMKPETESRFATVWGEDLIARESQS